MQHATRRGRSVPVGGCGGDSDPRLLRELAAVDHGQPSPSLAPWPEDVIVYSAAMTLVLERVLARKARLLSYSVAELEGLHDPASCGTPLLCDGRLGLRAGYAEKEAAIEYTPSYHATDKSSIDPHPRGPRVHNEAELRHLGGAPLQRHPLRRCLPHNHCHHRCARPHVRPTTCHNNEAPPPAAATTIRGVPQCRAL